MAMEKTFRSEEIQEIPIVEDFPKELPGLPADREVEFEIELEPGTTLTRKVLYRMALIELRSSWRNC